MMSNYAIAVYVNFWSWHIHGSHSVYLLKLGVTVLKDMYNMSIQVRYRGDKGKDDNWEKHNQG
jgi:hypothetical protein